MGHVGQMEEKKSAYIILVGKILKERNHLGDVRVDEK
jgi:hypothetical protein